MKQFNIFNKYIINIILIFSLITIILPISSCDEDEVNQTLSQDANEQVTGWIDEKGGSLVMKKVTAKLVVPPEAIAVSSDVTMGAIKIPASLDGLKLVQVGQAIELGPEGLHFDHNKNTMLTIPYDPNELTKRGLSQNNVRIFYYNPELNTYVDLGGKIDLTNHTISTSINHFSVYVALAFDILVSSDQTPPVIGNPFFVPDRMVSLPFDIRFNIRDHKNAAGADTTNALANVECYWEVVPSNPSLVAQGTVLKGSIINMERYTATNDTYHFTLPANTITSQQDTLIVKIVARDNVGFISTKTFTAQGGFRKLTSVSSITPSSLSITGGYQQLMSCRGSVEYQTTSTSGTTTTTGVMYLDPNGWEVIPNTGFETVELGYFTGNVFTAKAAGSGIIKPVFSNLAVNVQCNLIVYAGQLKDIRIVNEAGEIVSEGKFYLLKNQTYKFDAIGIDEYGNKILLYPNWAASAAVGNIETLGANAGTLNTATARYTEGRAEGNVCISLGGMYSCVKVQVCETIGACNSDLTSEVLEGTVPYPEFISNYDSKVLNTSLDNKMRNLFYSYVNSEEAWRIYMYTGYLIRNLRKRDLEKEWEILYDPADTYLTRTIVEPATPVTIQEVDAPCDDPNNFRLIYVPDVSASNIEKIEVQYSGIQGEYAPDTWQELKSGVGGFTINNTATSDQQVLIEGILNYPTNDFCITKLRFELSTVNVWVGGTKHTVTLSSPQYLTYDVAINKTTGFTGVDVVFGKKIEELAFISGIDYNLISSTQAIAFSKKCLKTILPPELSAEEIKARMIPIFNTYVANKMDLAVIDMLAILTNNANIVNENRDIVTLSQIYNEQEILQLFGGMIINKNLSNIAALTGTLSVLNSTYLAKLNTGEKINSYANKINTNSILSLLHTIVVKKYGHLNIDYLTEQVKIQLSNQEKNELASYNEGHVITIHNYSETFYPIGYTTNSDGGFIHYPVTLSLKTTVEPFFNEIKLHVRASEKISSKADEKDRPVDYIISGYAIRAHIFKYNILQNFSTNWIPQKQVYGVASTDSNSEVTTKIEYPILSASMAYGVIIKDGKNRGMVKTPNIPIVIAGNLYTTDTDDELQAEIKPFANKFSLLEQASWNYLERFKEEFKVRKHFYKTQTHTHTVEWKGVGDYYNIEYDTLLGWYRGGNTQIVCITDHIDMAYCGESRLYLNGTIYQVGSAEDGNHLDHHILVLGVDNTNECCYDICPKTFSTLFDPLSNCCDFGLPCYEQGTNRECHDCNHNGIGDWSTKPDENTPCRIKCMNKKNEISVLAHPDGADKFHDHDYMYTDSYTGTEIYNGNTCGKIYDGGSDNHYHIDWWDRALSYGHRSYCFAGDDYEDNFFDTGSIVINSNTALNQYNNAIFKDDIRNGYFYSVVPDRRSAGLPGPKLIFKIIDNILFVILVKDEFSGDYPASIIVKGIRKTGGMLPIDIIPDHKTSNNPPQMIELNDQSFQSFYGIDFSKIDHTLFRGIRIEVRKQYTNQHVTLTAFSQPYYFDCNCNRIDYNGSEYRDDHYFP